ncbi:hypothetical protein JCM10135_13210 [Stetteria hydrogenophila]
MSDKQAALLRPNGVRPREPDTPHAAPGRGATEDARIGVELSPEEQRGSILKPSSKEVEAALSGPEGTLPGERPGAEKVRGIEGEPGGRAEGQRKQTPPSSTIPGFAELRRR